MALDMDIILKILAMFVIPGLAGLLAFLDGTRYRTQTKAAMELVIMGSNSLAADYKRQTELVQALEQRHNALETELRACKSDCQIEIMRLQLRIAQLQNSGAT